MNLKQVDSQKEVKRVVAEDMLPSLAVTTLPSKFLPYPKGAKVSYRPYMYGEVKRFSSSKFVGSQALDFALSGVEVSGFEKEDLTLSDAIFVALLRKISTLGSATFTVHYQCAHCGVTQTFNMDSGGLVFEDLEVPSLPAIATLSGGDMAFSPLTVRAWKSMMGKERSDDEVWCLAYMTSDPEGSYAKINRANPGDSKILDAVDRLMYHGVKSREEQCPGCKKVNSVEVDGGDVLISPFRLSTEHDQGGIRFGP